MQRKHWLLGALAMALWSAPAAAEPGSKTRLDGWDDARRDGDADPDVDYAGRWPFSGRSMSDRDWTTWRATWRAMNGGPASKRAPAPGSTSSGDAGDGGTAGEATGGAGTAKP